MESQSLFIVARPSFGRPFAGAGRGVESSAYGAVQHLGGPIPFDQPNQSKRRVGKLDRAMWSAAKPVKPSG
jgi:hypothetical protein